MKDQSIENMCPLAAKKSQVFFRTNLVLVLALFFFNPAAMAMTVAVYEFDYAPGKVGLFSGSDFLLTASQLIPASYPGAPNELLFESFNIAESTKVDLSAIPFDTIIINASDSIIIDGTLDATGKRLTLIAPIVESGSNAEIITDLLTVSTTPVTIIPIPAAVLLFMSGFGVLAPFAKVRRKT